MHLLILHQAWEFGGAERTTANLLTHRDRAKIQRVTLAGPTNVEAMMPAEIDAFVDLGGVIPHGWFPQQAEAVERDIDSAVELLERVRPDVVLGMMHYSGMLMALAGARCRPRIPTVASFRGPISQHIRRYEPGLARKLLIYRYLIQGSRQATRILVPSQGTADDSRRHFLAPRKRINVIPNGIDYDAVRDRSAFSPPTLDLGSPDELVIMVAARLSAEKDIAVLIRAFAAVRQTSPSRLVIVGDGHARADLEHLTAVLGLQSRVTFTGYQTPIYPFLWRADIYVHTCEFEGFGYAMLEAMACEAAVVATDCPTGPRELLDGGRYGVLVRPGRADDLARALNALVSAPEKRAHFVEQGVKRAQAYPVAAMVRGFEELFASIVRH
ncbi:hypothetical protein CKO42_04425 [Lamprobacter modestohalophilus]|uniref:Glycosyltransferase n=1 Tax=Lamprobacter modestohalophilus TaxID=1064514 RepID=A0A9X0W6A4_9GAMM|nr:hypothetical protein [Lamprobacter modestohalophilus]